MSLDDMFRHTLTVKHAVAALDVNGDPILDDYGQATTTPATLATVAGRIQPKSAREVALLSQAGAVVSTHIGYIYPLAGLTTACWIECEGQRYDIVGILDAAGAGHHLQLELVAVI